MDTRTVGGHSDGGWTLGRWVDTRAVGICSFQVLNDPKTRFNHLLLHENR